MQSIMGPMNLTDNGLVKKYIMGSRDRVWGESLDGCVFWGGVYGYMLATDKPGTRPELNSRPLLENSEDDATAPLRGRLPAGEKEQEGKPLSAEAKAERMEELLDKVFVGVDSFFRVLRRRAP